MVEAEHPHRVRLVEVGLRDGLQRESTWIPTKQKLALIDRLVDAGLKRLQVTSFVHPERVPQMADAEAVCAGLTPHVGVVYSALVLNRKGVERAVDAGLAQVDMGVSANDEHSRRNTNRSTKEAVLEFERMAAQAHASGCTVRGAIHCAFGYRSSKDVEPAAVGRLVDAFLDNGVDELALADSAGLANPWQIRDLVGPIVDSLAGLPLILHLHDTRGMGLANLLAALQCGVRIFDTAFGGLGGCPFIDNAAGNIPTEDSANMLNAMGMDTGIDIAKVALVSHRMAAMLKRPLSGKIYKLHPSASG